VVAEHAYSYDLNGNKAQDVARKQNADNPAAYLATTYDYGYDPRDRVRQVTKTGAGADTETYRHDANNNVIEQTIKNVRTTFNYDRNRLLTATAGTSTSSYNYDPFGRLDTVTGQTGQVLERYVYDGFDHIIEHRKTTGTGTATTRYSYDPLDRNTSKTTNAGTAGQKTTTFNYLGLSKEVLDEQVGATITKSYQYSPWGQRLSQTTHKTDGTEEDAYYGYNPHTDVETLTDGNGNTKATYGYTAYGNSDDAQLTGIDKPDAADPTKEPYNPYRFNAKRWDQNSQSYDMGFRDYSPGLNRFLTRDTYNGALADLNLGTNPWTGNRYAYGAGNPITNIEIDGHIFDVPGGGGGGSTFRAKPLADQNESPYLQISPNVAVSKSDPYRDKMLVAWHNYRQVYHVKGEPDFDVEIEMWKNICNSDLDTCGEERAREFGRLSPIFPLQTAEGGLAPFIAGSGILIGLGAGIRLASVRVGAAGAAKGVAPRFIGNAAGDMLDTTRITVPGGKAGYLVKDPRKAGIFGQRLGFDEAAMEAALRSHLTSNFGSVSDSVPMLNGVGEQIGTKFVVRGPMTGPSGRTFDITASWGVDYDGTVRFITAFPTN
jgi:RHS repeat-associated protein